MRPSQTGVEVFNSFQTGSTVQWRGEGDLVGFRLRGRRVNPSFSGSHYDHHAMQSNTFEKLSKPPQFYPAAEQLTSAVQAASAQLPPGFEPQRARAMTLDNYSDQLQSESERSMGSAVTGTGSSRNQSLMAGNTLTVEGMLDAKGTYGLVRVVHQWTPQGYLNSFVCTPWKNYRNPNPPDGADVERHRLGACYGSQRPQENGQSSGAVLLAGGWRYSLGTSYQPSRGSGSRFHVYAGSRRRSGRGV